METLRPQFTEDVVPRLRGGVFEARRELSPGADDEAVGREKLEAEVLRHTRLA